MADRSGWLSIFLGGIVGALITGGFNHLDKRADIDAKMIELSVGILRTEPTDDTRPLRQWAIDVIERRADFKFDEVQKAVLLKQTLPYKGPSFSTPTSASALPLGIP